MTSSAGGVTEHKIRWQEKVPVAVELSLKGGAKVEVDLVSREVVVVAGVLKAKKIEWCQHIADYIARQSLLEISEKSGKKRSDGRVGIQFEPRPDPKIIWWG